MTFERAVILATLVFVMLAVPAMTALTLLGRGPCSALAWLLIPLVLVALLDAATNLIPPPSPPTT